MLKSHCGRVRFVGRLEAISFLTLLGIAMPLKYLGDMPQAVQVVGWIHGMLFVGLGLFVLHAWLNKHLSLRWAMFTMIAACLPFGPLFIDAKLKAVAEQR